MAPCASAQVILPLPLSSYIESGSVFEGEPVLLTAGAGVDWACGGVDTTTSSNDDAARQDGVERRGFPGIDRQAVLLLDLYHPVRKPALVQIRQATRQASLPLF